MRKAILMVTTVVFSLGTLGCGSSREKAVFGKPVAVKGKVTLAGSPLTKGNVVFFPVMERGPENQFGSLDSKGNFSMAAFPGKYRIAIEPPWIKAESKPGTTNIPVKFQKANTAGFEIEIPESGKEDIAINLK